MAARQVVGLRLGGSGLEEVDKICEKTGAVRSVAIRVLLGEALRNTAVTNAATTRLMAMRETL